MVEFDSSKLKTIQFKLYLQSIVSTQTNRNQFKILIIYHEFGSKNNQQFGAFGNHWR